MTLDVLESRPVAPLSAALPSIPAAGGPSHASVPDAGLVTGPACAREFSCSIPVPAPPSMHPQRDAAKAGHRFMHRLRNTRLGQPIFGRVKSSWWPAAALPAVSDPEVDS
ncbi:hypothetical protein VTJ49DRAFT_6313 [Mycothermus thermophilus]|uniref:Uncharacterized protein n=1 Tax=Humicola insolens TaxID=85995 RepID=A0ABR3VK08_HUMIN